MTLHENRNNHPRLKQTDKGSSSIDVNFAGKFMLKILTKQPGVYSEYPPRPLLTTLIIDAVDNFNGPQR